MISEQLKAARALARLTIEELSSFSGVSIKQISRIERQSKPLKLHEKTQKALVKALAEKGVIFIDADSEGGPGVRLIKNEGEVE